MGCFFPKLQPLLVRAFYVGLLDGLLGVAGIMKLYEIDSDEMDHFRKSLRLEPVRLSVNVPKIPFGNLT